MPNSYDVNHGLSQCPPGPLEPVEVAKVPACPTCNDQGAVGNILTAQPCPDCAAPGVSTAGNPQPARDWELTCHECDGSGHVYVKHQVAMLDRQPKLPAGWQLALNLAIDAIEDAPPMDWPVNWPAILHGLKELRAALSAPQAEQGERDAK